LETRWFHCLRYPLRELPLLFPLAIALAATTSVTLLLLPRVLLGNWSTGALSPLTIPLVFWSFVPLLLAGHACMFLGRVAAHAARGEVKYIGWQDLDPWPPLASLGQWTACFLSGPALAAAVCMYYWLRVGTMRPLDWIIMAELVMPAVGYCLVAVLLVSQSDRSVPIPSEVLAAICRLGGFAFIASALAGAMLFAHLYVGMLAISQLHRNWMSGAIVFVLLWLSTLYCATFLMRLVGLWYYRVQRHRLSTPPRWAIPGLSMSR
jgi:hypothetical protein